MNEHSGTSEEMPERAFNLGQTVHVVAHALHVHVEVIVSDVSAAALAEKLLHVNDEHVAETRRELVRNHQKGCKPLTVEEKRLNRRLTRKLDWMISLRMLHSTTSYF
jgi:hypothetical protein